jgi:hypothetical protein
MLDAFWEAFNEFARSRISNRSLKGRGKSRNIATMRMPLLNYSRWRKRK